MSISPRLLIAAGLVALFVAIPLVYIFIRAIGAEPAAWQRLSQTRIWKLLGNTLLLVVAVTSGALFTGVSMAWLTERTDLLGRKILRWMLAMRLRFLHILAALCILRCSVRAEELFHNFLTTFLVSLFPHPARSAFGAQRSFSLCSRFRMSIF